MCLCPVSALTACTVCSHLVFAVIYLFFVILFRECLCGGFFCVRLLTPVLNNSHHHSESGPVVHSLGSSPLDGSYQSYLLLHRHAWRYSHMCTHKYTLGAAHDVHPVTLLEGAMQSANRFTSSQTSVRIRPDSVKGKSVSHPVLKWFH